MSAPKRGLFASIRGLLTTAVEVLQVRVELLATDVEAGSLRLFDAILLMLLAAVGIGVGLVLLAGLLLVFVQEAYRPHALAGMAMVFLGAGVWAALSARSRLRQAGRAFEATRAELARDVAALTPRDS